MVKIVINTSNRGLYTFVLFGVLILVGAGFLVVNAFGGSSPSVVGHSAGEMDLSGGVNGNAIFNGKVGIGTTNPDSTLHLYNSNNDYLNIDAAVGKHSLLAFSEAGVKKWEIFRNTAVGNDLAFYSYGITPGTVMALDYDTGNVGIGTTGPAGKFTVTGTSGAYAGSGVEGIAQFTTGTGINTDDKLQIGVVDGSYSWIQAVDPGTALRNLALNPGGGKVGIGTTEPFAKLDVHATQGD